MKSNTNKRLGRIAAGIFFLLNPNITVIDLLPDFIGCILIISGLGLLRDISDSLEEARKNFLRLFWVSLSHIPAFALMVSISASYLNEKTSILVFSFVYGVIEFILINNALTALIDGFVYVGQRYNGDSCFYEIKKNGKKVDVSHLRFFTTVFLIVTKGLSIAPNLVYLYDTSLGYGDILTEFAINPVSFIGPITAICFVPALVVGIVWAFRMCRYISCIRREETFISKVDEVVSDKAIQNTAVYKYRRTTTAVCILTAAVILSVDFYIDEFNIVPDIFSALLMLSGAIYMKRKFSDTGILACVVASLYTVAEVLMLMTSVHFSSSFKFSDVGRVVEADAAFSTYLLVLAASEVLFVITVAFILASYNKVLLGGFESAVRHGHTKGGKDVFFETHKKRNILAVVLALLSGICHFVQIFSMGDMKRILIDKNAYTDASGIYVPSLEGFWMVSLVTSIAFIVFMIYNYSKSKDELKERLYIL